MTDTLEAIEARRAERKEALEKQRLAQLAVDLVALERLEEEHGDSNVARIDVPYTPGAVTFVVVKTPSSAYYKRWKSRVKPDAKGRPGDAVAAAEELASVCRVYPDETQYEALCEARPGLHVKVGLEALKLSTGQAESEGKD